MRCLIKVIVLPGVLHAPVSSPDNLTSSSLSSRLSPHSGNSKRSSILSGSSIRSTPIFPRRTNARTRRNQHLESVSPISSFSASDQEVVSALSPSHHQTCSGLTHLSDVSQSVRAAGLNAALEAMVILIRVSLY
ncbi:unnamed protein product [Protopolystoma xenopodis]|uniref:Uncharacterized protein n=1 Tax=Protopolystoma xenopodis TaxID=117903 RepID=A0A448XHU6_9PLAT|nr:unnamed protein product [Protopolystoma xenopodis]